MSTLLTATRANPEPGVSGGSGRLLSLDVYRGLTVAGMILVTDPGTYSAVYPQLRHAEWMGATATDMIFPSFLLIVGVSIALTMRRRLERGAARGELARRVLRRSVVLFVLGLAVNGFPDYAWGSLRVMGILQRISLCYLGSGLLYLAVSRREMEGARSRISRTGVLLAGAGVALLAVYWALLRWVPVPEIGAGHLDSYGNLPSYLDRAVFGTRHLWAYGLTPGRGVTYDPEGLLSTMGAIASTLAGVVAGEWMRTANTGRRKALVLAGTGAVLVLLGWGLSPWLPINKRIWTSTFGLLSIGVSLLLLAFFHVIVDVWRSRWWTAPALVFGTNAILAFVVSSILTSLGIRIKLGAAGDPVGLHTWLYERLFATWLPPMAASLAYAIGVVLLNLLLLAPLYRRRVFLRV